MPDPWGKNAPDSGSGSATLPVRAARALRISGTLVHRFHVLPAMSMTSLTASKLFFELTIVEGKVFLLA
jgi:hypothetical protein